MKNSLGGNDQLTKAGAQTNYLYGDARLMEKGSSGGKDVLSCSAGGLKNYLYGDAKEMKEGSSGGNDVLIAGDNWSSESYVTDNYLYGDTFKVIVNETDGPVICGNDRLVIGTGTDYMWGDFDSRYSTNPTLATTGHDVFVFSENNGQDTIYDFHRGEDKIELQGIDGVSSFEDLIGKLAFGDETIITLSSDNTITLISVTQLDASDFTFT